MFKLIEKTLGKENRILIITSGRYDVHIVSL